MDSAPQSKEHHTFAVEKHVKHIILKHESYAKVSVDERGTWELFQAFQYAKKQEIAMAGHVCAVLLNWFHLKEIRSDLKPRERVIEFPVGRMKTDFTEITSPERAVKSEMTLQFDYSASAKERINEIIARVQHLGWYELEYKLVPMFNPNALVTLCQNSGLTIRSYYPDRTPYFEVEVQALGTEGRPALLVFRNLLDEYVCSLTICQDINGEGLEEHFYEKLHPDAIIALFIPAFTGWAG
ncbi:hypothetical protein AMJ40_06440 [candidate division TA06 bacterium DG_26]|uniref:Uncharacterized protein n=1 Tax=candidate division TA06 bacterium DG_26 TaxID=1703771 RepID=A0A0S7WFT5_UNCT6|nr:MAG: hypothetical protein AMJ40_06440 [candidate division TA06 bacterium DG_26]